MKLNTTDQTFEDYRPEYFVFENTEYTRKCQACNKKFTTKLLLLKYCSRQHQAQALERVCV